MRLLNSLQVFMLLTLIIFGVGAIANQASPIFIRRPPQFKKSIPDLVNVVGSNRSVDSEASETQSRPARYTVEEAGYHFNYDTASELGTRRVLNIDAVPAVIALACVLDGEGSVRHIHLRWFLPLPPQAERAFLSSGDVIIGGPEWRCGSNAIIYELVRVESVATDNHPETVLRVKLTSPLHVFRKIDLNMSWRRAAADSVQMPETSVDRSQPRRLRNEGFEKVGQLGPYSFNYDESSGHASAIYDLPFFMCSNCYAVADGTWNVGFQTNGLSLTRVSFNFTNVNMKIVLQLRPKGDTKVGDASLSGTGWQTAFSLGALNLLAPLVNGLGFPFFALINSATLKLKVEPSIRMELNLVDLEQVAHELGSADFEITSPPELTYCSVSWTSTGGYKTSFNIKPQMTPTFAGTQNGPISIGMRLPVSVAFWMLDQRVTSLAVAPEVQVSANYNRFASFSTRSPAPLRLMEGVSSSAPPLLEGVSTDAPNAHLCVQFEAFAVTDFWMVQQGPSSVANNPILKLCFAASCIQSKIGTWTTTGLECNCTGLGGSTAGCSKEGHSSPWCYVDNRCPIKKGVVRSWATCNPNKVFFWSGPQCMPIQSGLLKSNNVTIRALDKDNDVTSFFDIQYAPPVNFSLDEDTACMTEAGCQKTISLRLFPRGTGIYRKRPSSMTVTMKLAVYDEDQVQDRPVLRQTQALQACEGIGVALQLGLVGTFGGFTFPQQLGSAVPPGLWIDPVVVPLVPLQSTAAACVQLPKALTKAMQPAIKKPELNVILGDATSAEGSKPILTIGGVPDGTSSSVSRAKPVGAVTGSLGTAGSEPVTGPLESKESEPVVVKGTSVRGDFRADVNLSGNGSDASEAVAVANVFKGHERKARTSSLLTYLGMALVAVFCLTGIVACVLYKGRVQKVPPKKKKKTRTLEPDGVEKQESLPTHQPLVLNAPAPLPVQPSIIYAPVAGTRPATQHIVPHVYTVPMLHRLPIISSTAPSTYTVMPSHLEAIHSSSTPSIMAHPPMRSVIPQGSHAS